MQLAAWVIVICYLLLTSLQGICTLAAAHQSRGAARTGVAEDEVEDIEVLGAEDIAVSAVAVAVAVHDGGCRGREHKHVDALGHVSPAHEAPLNQAQSERLQRAR